MFGLKVDSDKINQFYLDKPEDDDESSLSGSTSDLSLSGATTSNTSNISREYLEGFKIN